MNPKNRTHAFDIRDSNNWTVRCWFEALLSGKRKCCGRYPLKERKSTLEKDFAAEVVRQNEGYTGIPVLFSWRALFCLIPLVFCSNPALCKCPFFD